jgi:hypothetical protein
MQEEFNMDPIGEETTIHFLSLESPYLRYTITKDVTEKIMGTMVSCENQNGYCGICAMLGVYDVFYVGGI